MACGLPSGPLHPNWKGGHERKKVYQPGGTYKKHAVVVAERALGKSLQLGAIVHHVDEDGHNDRSNNLVILQSIADHLELHRRMRVRAAGGDPWRDRICRDCGPRPLEAFRPRYTNANGVKGYCRCIPCEQAHDRRRRQRKVR